MSIFEKNKPSVLARNSKKYLSFINSRDGVICKAPFASLYFSSNGRIGPCCIYNQGLSFGYYPQNTIEQVLKSEHRKKLQHYINKACFDFGCTLCGQSIESGNFEGAISTQYKDLTIKPYPDKLEFELSNYCNLDCIMCGSHNNIKESSLYNNDQFYNEILPFITNASICNFYGGEPFLIESYYKIWDLIKNHNNQCSVYIQTNGTICNSRVIQILENMNVNLGVSLDSISEEKFQSIRRGASLKKVMENIEVFNKILKTKNSCINISITPIPSNICEINEIFDYCNRIHAEVFINTVHFPRQFSIARMSSSELFNHYNILVENKPITFDNPNFEYNKNKLQSFIEMIFYYANRNKEIEKNGSYEKLSDVISKISLKIKNEVYSNQFCNIFKNFDQNQIISPIVIADISSFDDKIFSETIIENLKLGNNSNIIKIIGIYE